MKDSKIDRINELARKSREAPLSQDELEEQALLRKQYIEAYRANLKGTLDNIKLK